MQEYDLKVLEQYNIDVIGTRKTRGAILCDTCQGLLLLREVSGGKRKIPALCELYEYLDGQGCVIDSILPNKEGECISAGEDGGAYILKHWFAGRECDAHKPPELLRAVGSLAKLHTVMCTKLNENITQAPHLSTEYARHNRELTKVRRFTRGISPKGEFEFAFLKWFDYMYGWADRALAETENSAVEQLYEQSVEKCCMTHGEYNYHNILMVPGGRETTYIATTNFDKFKIDVQVEDLYYFLRKVMEKQGWKERLGDNMLNAYSAIKPLSQTELEYIKIRLIYPEKFWKIADSYYHSNKAWISVKSIEKLNTAIRQTEEKKRFLENIFAFHL